jgi:ferredoxin
MSIEIIFEPDHLIGLVAEGTLVLNAARRMGVRIDDECGGLGECDTCAVTVVRGAELLSPVTAAELKQLDDNRRAAGERLACQVTIERSGELVLRIAPEVEKAEENVAIFRREFSKRDLTHKMAFIMEFEKAIVMRKPVAVTGDEVEAAYRREFNDHPLDRKLAILLELEGAAAIHGVINVANLPFTIGEKVMDVMASRARRVKAEGAGANTADESKDQP